MRNDVLNELEKLKLEDLEMMNKSEIARRFNCDVRTITKYVNKIKSPPKKEPVKRRIPTKLDGLEEIINDKVDKYGATAKSVFYFLVKEKNYSGGYTTVANYIRKHKDLEKKKATVRFETIPGFQAQVDWKEEFTLVNRNGEIIQINIFLMVLGYSRIKYLQVTSDRSQNTLFNCMINAFKYFGGVPEEIVFDNMKTVVDRSKSDFKKVQINDKFRQFAADMNFNIFTCRPYRPQTKGKVEALAKLTDRLIAFNEEFDTYEDVVKLINEFMNDINNEKSQGSDEIPFNRHKEETKHLHRLPSEDLMKTYNTRSRAYKVSKESMIKYEGKKYSVPIKYIGKSVSVSTTDSGHLEIYYTGERIACHQISDNKFHYNREHLSEILKSDVMKGRSPSEIETFVNEKLSVLDTLLEE